MSVRLPAAAPGYGRTVQSVDLDRCWADFVVSEGSRPLQCRARATHPVGLCDMHAEELLP